MSDNPRNDNWRDGGATLPNNISGTYNIGLSPFWIARNGRIDVASESDDSLILRGEYGRLWPATSYGPAANRAYIITINDRTVQPSDYNLRFIIISLRCLVSTTNS